jgi:hypothetical protein
LVQFDSFHPLPSYKIDPIHNIDPIIKTDPIQKKDSISKTDPIHKTNPISKTDPNHKTDHITKTDPIHKADHIPKTYPIHKTYPISKTNPIHKTEPPPIQHLARNPNSESKLKTAITFASELKSGPFFSNRTELNFASDSFWPRRIRRF